MKSIIYGRHPVFETLLARRRKFYLLRIAKGVQEKGVFQEILRKCKSLNVPIRYDDRDSLNAIEPRNQGVLLEASGYPYSDIENILKVSQENDENPFLLVLDSLQDPQNFGTLLRTAEAVGVHGVIIPKRRSVAVTPAVVSASSGASEHLLISQENLVQVIKKLKSADIWVIGLDQNKTAQYPSTFRLDGSTAIVVGSEGKGLRPLVRKSCDLLMQLPMRGNVKSLNAAVAGSVALYLTWQARSDYLASHG